MIFSMTQDEFLTKKDISKQEWEEASIEWKALVEIAQDFCMRQEHFESNAEYISARLRTFPGVHSVRWRIKNIDNLLKKIVRKKLDPNSHKKWKDVNVNNYLKVVTDLIGVRALHLIKEECVEIDEAIHKEWKPTEVTIWRREGDAQIDTLRKPRTATKLHPDGYRSIHYLVKAQEKLTAEIQVRTIFQEGWSEIDHRVKYPDHSDNKQIEYFLRLFNSLAGNADEMGSYIIGLVKHLKDNETQTSKMQELIDQKNRAEENITEQLDLLAALKNQDAASQDLISKLRAQILKLQSANAQSLIAATISGTAHGTVINKLIYGAGVALASARAGAGVEPEITITKNDDTTSKKNKP